MNMASVHHLGCVAPSSREGSPRHKSRDRYLSSAILRHLSGDLVRVIEGSWMVTGR